MGQRGHSSEPPAGRVEVLLDAAADALETGRPEEALARAEEAAVLEPRSAPALHYRAAALEELGRTAEARAAYQRALAAGKDDPELLLGAARFLVEGLPEEEAELVDLEEGLSLARRGFRRAERAGATGLATELLLVEARALSQLGSPGEALAALERAGKDAPDDDAILREKGFALHELCRFDEAHAALAAAVEVDPEDAWAVHALGLLAERRGDRDQARRLFARARKLDPDEFPRPVALSHQAFEAVVEDALADVPESVRHYLANVAVTVEDLPADADLLGSDPPLSPGILGLFRGAPYGQKASMDPWSHFPSSIVLYQRNLERYARSREELIEEIRVTLIHEVGHFLGLDEDELYQRGLD
jgi:predicted Zn-dependent protease with MMP-like domain/Flp pilus assembly protein TadD